MARALRLEFEGALYHLCARGNRRERIFADEKDCLRFLALLKESLGRYEVEVHAYVLMPNHFHLLARTPKANLSRWMHWLIGAYSISFNRRHRKSGHLFQGRYKSFLVEGGNYLLGLSRYLHLNPVRGRVIGVGDPKERRKRLRAYRWSSYRGYAGLGKQNDFVSEELVLGELDGSSKIKIQQAKLRYRRFVEEGLLREIENPFEAVQWQMVLGSESLLQKVKDKMRSKSDHQREVTGLRSAASRSEPKRVMARVAAHYGLPVNRLLREPVYGSEARNVAIWLAWQNSGLTLREIGSMFGGMDYAAVSQRIRRIQKQAETNKKLKHVLAMLNV
jgi:REP element-mobilizing transposase RayT